MRWRWRQRYRDGATRPGPGAQRDGPARVTRPRRPGAVVRPANDRQRVGVPRREAGRRIGV